MKNKIFNYIIIAIIFVIIVFTMYLIINRNKETLFTTNDTSIILKINESKKIDYQISDENKFINWKSSDYNTVSVDNGTITGINLGAAVVTGTIVDNDKEKTITCYIVVKSSNYDIPLEDFVLPDGEILLSVDETFYLPLTPIPSNGNTDDINYYVDNIDVVRIENGFITGLKEGYTNLVVTSGTISKKTIVNVVKSPVIDHVVKPIDNIEIIVPDTIYLNEETTIKYETMPEDANIYDIKWNINDEKIISIDNDNIKGLQEGSTTIEFIINNKIKKYIDVTVKSKIKDIVFNYSPKEILKVGETLVLRPTIIPSDISGDNIIFESSNPYSLEVSNDGKIIAKSRGNAIITIRNNEGTVKKTLSFTVVNNKGLISSDKTIWGFTKNSDVIPKEASTEFFRELVKKGRGTLSGDTYTYQKYSYNIKTNLLTINNQNKIFMRIYYPENKDLSSLNTFTFIGGIGEGSFSGYFESIRSNPSIIKNSGIVILIPESNSAKIYPENVVEATNFVKTIINQNSNARNSIGGYSNGGPTAGEAADKGHYDKIMLINTSFYWINSKNNIKNMEYVVYSARGDSWKGTGSFINELYKYGIKNVTVVTNNSDFVNSFKDKYLVINPGNSMKNGHTSENLTLSHFFSYACD